MDDFSKFSAWFFTEILGVWFIWASYMAALFVVDNAQGVKAAFDFHGQHQGTSGFVVIPVILSVVYSLVTAVMWANK